MQTLGNLSSSRPLLPDLLALPAYALLAAGLLGFSRRSTRTPLRQSSLVLDGAIAALAVASLAWVFAIQPLLARQDAPLPVVLILVAYPSLSVFMVVVTLRIVFNPEQDLVPAFWFLLSGMSLMLLGDVLYMLADLNVRPRPPACSTCPTDWHSLCAGATALHASMGALTLPGAASVQPHALSHHRDRAGPRDPHRAHSAIDSRPVTDRSCSALHAGLMTAAAVLRTAQALRTAESSEARLFFLANHDGLTGLPNRRMMEQHLSDLLVEPARRHPRGRPVSPGPRPLQAHQRHARTQRGDELLIEVAGACTPTCGRGPGHPHRRRRVHGHAGRRGQRGQAVDLANRLRSRLRTPFTVHGMDLLRVRQHRPGLRLGRRPQRPPPRPSCATPTPPCTRPKTPAATPWRLRRIHARAHDRACRARARPALRPAHEPAPPRLSAHRAPAPRQRGGHGGAGALVAPHALASSRP